MAKEHRVRHICEVLGMLAIVMVWAGCSSAGPGPDLRHEGVNSRRPVQVTISTSMGDVVVELDPKRAPITVANFLMYTDAGLYDGTIVHRVVRDFVIQGGGWTPEMKERAKEAGKPDVAIRNEWRNGLKNARGTIAMARDEGPDTATREFFINLKDNTKLDTAREKTGNAGYAVFGRVVKGMDVVDRIAAVKTHSVNVPGVTDGSMENVPEEPVLVRSVRRAR